MARDWKESDHPRHPAKSPGGAGGRFRENVGGAGWAMRLASMLGKRRSRGTVARVSETGIAKPPPGHPDWREPGTGPHGPFRTFSGGDRPRRRVGGRSDLGDTSASDLRRALAESDADYARGLNPRDAAIRDEDVATITDPNMGGMASGQAMAIRLESLGDVERARRAYRGLRPGQQEGIRASLQIESAGLRRGELYMPQQDVDLANEQAILDRLYPGAARQRLRDLADRERMDEGGNLPRLTSQDVADALAPPPSWAGGLRGAPGGYRPRRAPDGDYGDPDNQEAWEYEVRRLLHRRSVDPNQIDEEVGGFGEDYQEWWHDPAGYVNEILSATDEYE